MIELPPLLCVLLTACAVEGSLPAEKELERFPPLEVCQEWDKACRVCVDMCERNMVDFPNRGWGLAYMESYRLWYIPWHLVLAHQSAGLTSRQHLAEARRFMGEEWWYMPWRIEIIPYRLLPRPPEPPTPAWFFYRERKR